MFEEVKDFFGKSSTKYFIAGIVAVVICVILVIYVVIPNKKTSGEDNNNLPYSDDVRGVFLTLGVIGSCVSGVAAIAFLHNGYESLH